jgi:hypothetical protein
MSACQRVFTLATKTAVVIVTGAVTDTAPIKSAQQTRVFPFYFHLKANTVPAYETLWDLWMRQWQMS